MTALALSEIIHNVFENFSDTSDLLACACVNKLWNEEALRLLYRGSLADMQFRSPDIESLNCLLVASRQRFSFNMGFVKHLLLHPEMPSTDKMERSARHFASFARFRALRRRQDIERMISSSRTCLTSLTIPFEIIDKDLYQVADLLQQKALRFLSIDVSYCGLIANCLSPPCAADFPTVRSEAVTTSTR